MRRTILIAVALITGLATTTGFIFSRMTQKMTINVNAKDLPEYGLVIIRPTDPNFDFTAAQLLKGATSDELESLKPFSAIITNNGNKTVVAYTVIWEGLEQSGIKKPYIISHSNFEAFIDLEDYLDGLTRSNLDDTIKPGSAQLVSMLPLQQRSSSAGGNNLQNIQSLSSQLSKKYIDITVSIDGVFFDDGTFAGPDTSNFFDNLQAQVNAKRDLIDGMSEKLKLGKDKGEIFEEIKAKAQDNSITRRPDYRSSPTDQYKYFSKFFATQFLQLRKAYGDDKALEKALRPKRKPWQALRKLNEQSK